MPLLSVCTFVWNCYSTAYSNTIIELHLAIEKLFSHNNGKMLPMPVKFIPCHLTIRWARVHSTKTTRNMENGNPFSNKTTFHSALSSTSNSIAYKSTDEKNKLKYRKSELTVCHCLNYIVKSYFHFIFFFLLFATCWNDGLWGWWFNPLKLHCIISIFYLFWCLCRWEKNKFPQCARLLGNH